MSREIDYSPAADFSYNSSTIRSLRSIEIVLVDRLLSENFYEMDFVVLPSFVS